MRALRSMFGLQKEKASLVNTTQTFDSEASLRRLKETSTKHQYETPDEPRLTCQNRDSDNLVAPDSSTHALQGS